MTGVPDLVRYFAEVEPGQLDDLAVGIRRQAAEKGSEPDGYLAEIRRQAQLQVIAEARQSTQ